jgi:ketosteroid isomerase-like protein
MTQAVTLSKDRITKALDTYYEGMSRLDMRASISAFAPDGMSEDPRGSEVHRGRPAIEAYFTGLAGALDSFSIEPTAVHPSGEGVAVAWKAHWHGKNGRSGDFTGIDVVTLDAGGSITELVGYWDADTVVGEMTSA